MKKQNLRIALAQINCAVGDMDGNFRKITGYIKKSEESGADIVVFPELAVSGYPPEDLLFKPKFIEDNLGVLNELTRLIGDTAVVVGFADKKDNALYNAAAIIYSGKIRGVYHKILLPNYAVFDEKRYFQAGTEPLIFRFGDVSFGVNICEDIWHKDGPVEAQVSAGAKLILNINASPYHAGKIKEREEIVKGVAKKNHVPVVYVNLIGGQDELVFDGQSMVVDGNGKITARAQAFKEDLLIQDLFILKSPVKASKKMIMVSCEIPHKNKSRLSMPAGENMRLAPEAEIYQSLVLGLKDYVAKNGFQKVVIGLSGGIDSALVTVLAVDALGKENVTAVFMPSRYSSLESETDAAVLVDNLGIKLLCIPIEQIYKMYLMLLEPLFAGTGKNITEENLQARIRGNILMALSNKFGWLVLTTGNKSEMSTGYATLYGDMAGGLAVIKDVPKMLVYKLSRHRNSLGAVIPENIFIKAPTAELKPNQKDSDALPVYEKLDPILQACVEEDRSAEEIISDGFDAAVVCRVMEMVDKSEYKRRQSPPGIKITPKAFGKDRRMPITNKYRG